MYIYIAYCDEIILRTFFGHFLDGPTDIVVYRKVTLPIYEINCQLSLTHERFGKTFFPPLRLAWDFRDSSLCSP